MAVDILALPHKVGPEVGKWRDEFPLLPAALYTLFDISSADLVRLQEACEAQCEIHRRGDCVRPPPGGHSNFSGRDLTAIVTHHLQLADESKDFDPTLFIVAVAPDWDSRGVLLVTLDSDGHKDDCHPDKFWVKAVESGGCFVSLSIGQSDWQAARRAFAVSA